MAGKVFEIDALIRSNDKVNAGFIEFPFDVAKEFGGKGRVKVKVLIDGRPYRGSLVKVGGDCHWLGKTQQVRKLTGKNPGLMEFFNGLSYTHRKEYIR